MDYVYICRGGENEELRYSLRSLAKNAPDGRVWLVGGKPSWYVGDFIEVPISANKYSNARSNLNKITKSLEISEEFVLMNDDFFFVKEVDQITDYHGGTLIEKIKRYREDYGNSSYISMLVQTYKVLKRLGVKEPLDYELHVPMRMTKNGLADVLGQQSLWRSSYGNLQAVGGKEIKDVKVYGMKSMRTSYEYGSTDTPYISTEDNSFAEKYHSMFKLLFPTPSEYETSIDTF